MSPIDQSINIIRQEQQLIPAAVAAFHQTKGANKLLAAHLLQELAGDSGQLIEPVYRELQAGADSRHPIKILEVMYSLRHSPESELDRLLKMKHALVKYLCDTLISKYMPEKTEMWHATYSKILKLQEMIDYFGYWYPQWWEIEVAIRSGLIRNNLEYYRWIEQGRPVRFAWGKTSLERRAMLEWIEHWKTEYYRSDLFRG